MVKLFFRSVVLQHDGPFSFPILLIAIPAYLSTPFTLRHLFSVCAYDRRPIVAGSAYPFRLVIFVGLFCFFCDIQLMRLSPFLLIVERPPACALVAIERIRLRG